MVRSAVCISDHGRVGSLFLKDPESGNVDALAKLLASTVAELPVLACMIRTTCSDPLKFARSRCAPSLSLAFRAISRFSGVDDFQLHYCKLLYCNNVLLPPRPRVRAPVLVRRISYAWITIRCDVIIILDTVMSTIVYCKNTPKRPLRPLSTPSRRFL